MSAGHSLPSRRRSRNLNRIVLAVALAASALAAWVLGFHRELPRLGELPDFELRAATAVAQSHFSSRDLIGRPWVADFIFTSCAGPCPALSSRMAVLHKSLPREFGFLSFTVDPDRDSPEILQGYAARFGADPRRWYFLTGDKARLYRLLREGFKIAAVANSKAPLGFQVTHSTKFVLLDCRKTIRGYYDGDDPTALARLQKDAGRLPQEGSVSSSLAMRLRVLFQRSLLGS